LAKPSAGKARVDPTNPWLLRNLWSGCVFVRLLRHHLYDGRRCGPAARRRATL